MSSSSTSSSPRSWKDRAGPRRLSSAQLKAESLFSKASANATVARVQAITNEFRNKRERKRKHNRQRVKDLSHRPLSAAVGHTGDSSFRLAMLMANGGNNVARDDEHALILLKQASKLHHTGSLTALGEFYQAGRGRDRTGMKLDIPKQQKAMASFKSAASKGDRHASLRMGILLEQTDVWEARRYYYQAAKDDKKKSEIGLADAQFNLAMINSKIGNYKETLPWLLKASVQHHLGAINNLGMLYMTGLGCSKNINKAKTYFVKGAHLNDPYSMFNLATMHLQEGSLLLRNSNWCQADANERDYQSMHQSISKKERSSLFNNDDIYDDDINDANAKIDCMIEQKSPGWVQAAMNRQMQQSMVFNSQVLHHEQSESMNLHIDTMKSKSNYHYQQAEFWLKKAAHLGHHESAKNYGILLQRKGQQKEGLYWMNRSGLETASVTSTTCMNTNLLDAPPSIVSMTNSAIDYNDDIFHTQDNRTIPVMLPHFEQRPSTTLSSHPLSHQSLQGTEISETLITSPKSHMEHNFSHYYSNNYKKKKIKDKELDGLRLIPIPKIQTSTLERQQKKRQEQNHLLKPKASAFFWGDQTKSNISPIKIEQRRKQLIMTTRISKPIHINKGKYFVPIRSKNRSINSSSNNNNNNNNNKNGNARKKSTNEVDALLNLNFLNANENNWSETILELKNLCLERNIDAKTSGIYNPKDKSIELRRRIAEAIQHEKDNIHKTVKEKADKLSGRHARQKLKLGLRLTSIEKKQLESKTGGGLRRRTRKNRYR